MTEAAVEQAESKQKNVLVLKLRGTKKPSISWAANTIDNEDMGKKSSKRKTSNTITTVRQI
jgi:Protein phosphatase inhibitor